MHTSRRCSMDSGAWTDLISNATMPTNRRDTPWGSTATLDRGFLVAAVSAG
ncbi:hypothetical protein ACIP4Y_37745 [Streptomyces sp. NPDC088810]|uniref:hypothetical protein n=1 Tax=Streptomyces sp. NPDC088810 TaxID=3365904 RepID=UPI003818796A